MKFFSVTLFLLHVFKNTTSCAALSKATDPASLTSPSRDLMNVARAARWYELGEGVGSENSNEKTGHCVATSVDGQILAVSSPLYKSGNNIDAGRVRVYGFDPIHDKWIPMGSDIIGPEFSQSGSALAMAADGKTLIVGMPNHDNDSGKEAGTIKVYSFENLGGTGEEEWVQKGPTLIGFDDYAHFGAAVAISNDGRKIAVGSPTEGAVFEQGKIGTEAGTVNVYEYEYTADDWYEYGYPLVGSETYGHFGAAVGLDFDGKNLVVGAPDHGPYNAGLVRFFHFNETTRLYDDAGDMPAMALGDRFGATVDMSLDGRTVIAGAPMHKGSDVKTHSGHARVFERTDYSDVNPTVIEWKRKGRSLIGLDEGDQAGTSVSVSSDGNIVAVGSAYSDKMGKNSGRITLYLWDDIDGWVDMDLNVEGHGPLDYLGTSVALSQDGTEVAVGAPGGQYAKIFALRSTQPPTMSPIDFKEETDIIAKKSKKRVGGFRVFFNILVIALLTITCIFGVFKGGQFFMRKMKDGKLEAVPPSDLEMRMKEDGEEGEML